MPAMSPPPSPDMLDLLTRIRAGAVLVTGERKTKCRLQLHAELDGEHVSTTLVRGLIRRDLVRVASRTARTQTWAAAEGQS